MFLGIALICLAQHLLETIETTKTRRGAPPLRPFSTVLHSFRCTFDLTICFVQWRLLRPSEFIVSEATIFSASSKAAKVEIDTLVDAFNSDMAVDNLNTNQDSSEMNTRTASNLQMVHHLTMRLCEVDDFDEVSKITNIPHDLQLRSHVCSSASKQRACAVALSSSLCFVYAPRATLCRMWLFDWRVAKHPVHISFSSTNVFAGQNDK